MKYRVALPLLLFVATLPHEALAGSKSLHGSRASMQRQNEIARKSDYSFLRTPRQVKEFVQSGRLVPLPGNDDYRLEDAAYPYGRPEVKLFVERLAADYHSVCGEQLVVTSVTRPTTRQPRNAHPLSVHPAGMAVDLRISNSRDCLGWLENTLLDLEGEDLLDVTREHHPPHLHVAVFPQAYREHIEKLIAEDAARQAPLAEPVAAPAAAPATASVVPHSTPWPWLVAAASAAAAFAAVSALINRRRRAA